MGLLVGGAPASADAAVARRVRLTTASGDYTVPDGVTRLVVLCKGGGGGGASLDSNGGAAGGVGGTTTFSTVSALGGLGATEGMEISSNSLNGQRAPGTSARNNTGLPGTGAVFLASSGSGAPPGGHGQEKLDTLTVSPGQVISYTVGPGGAGGAISSTGDVGGNGGSGYIELEY